MDIAGQIIKTIKINRISTTEIADCLGKTGALKGVKPVNRGHHKVGRIFAVYAYDNSNWDLHRQLQNIPRESMVVVETFNVDERAVFGHLVSKYITLYCGAEAIIVNGQLRDAHLLIKDNFPIWCQGVTPIGCFNRESEHEVPQEYLDELETKYSGAIAVADDGGCIVIPKQFQNQDFLNRLDFIELQEDIWYYCIDTKKWDTYKTVCLKEYLKSKNELPTEFHKRLKKYEGLID